MMLLPRPNRDTIEVVFVFLRWVASFSGQNDETGSKMDLANLATVITPNVLYGRGANAARDESFIGITAVQILLEKQDDFYRVPPELMYVLRDNVAGLFTKDLDLAPKEIHKLCTKYLNKRGGPWPGPQGGSGGPQGGGSQSGGGSGAGSGNTGGGGGGGGGGMGPRPSYSGPSSSGPPQSMRDGMQGGRDTRQSDLRLSTVAPYRNDSRNDSISGVPGSEESNTGTLRATPSPNNGMSGSRPTSWATAPGTAPGTPGTSTPTANRDNGNASVNATPNANSNSKPGSNKNPMGLTMPMPTPQINGTPAVISPGGTFSHAMPLPSPGWRGPFQGPASNGSRQSSRGSAPPSPGVAADERRSFQMERDRSRDRA